MDKHVFVNRTLNLRKIKWIGLDMDHTLVRYDTEAFEKLAYQNMLKKLVEDKQYPEQIKDLKFDIHSVIRGLVIDSQKGNLLKVSRHGAIRASKHGTQKIDFKEQQRSYRGTYVDLSKPEFSSIDTAFSLSVAALFAQLVDLTDSLPSWKVDYGTLRNDIIEVMDMSHRDDSIKSIVRANLEKYILQEPEVARGLERFKKHGKKLFILTNSDFHYTKTLLEFAIDPYLKEHKSWMELFDFTITSARKPRFFYVQTDYLKVHPDNGTMTNYDNILEPGIYQGGWAAHLEKSLQAHGEDILYIGDHIYGDIVRLKKDCRWRTALVIEELETEIEQMHKAMPLQNEINALMQEKVPLEEKHVEAVTFEIENDEKTSSETTNLQTKISELDAKISENIRKINGIFNENWGEVMRSGNEESYFASQVDRYADIYMPHLANLLGTSPRTYFRSTRRPLAHESRLKMILESED